MKSQRSLMWVCTKDLCCSVKCCHLFGQRCGGLLYADDLVQISETIEGLRNKFWKLKKAFESKSLEVSFGKVKVMAASQWMASIKVNLCTVWQVDAW